MAQEEKIKEVLDLGDRVWIAGIRYKKQIWIGCIVLVLAIAASIWVHNVERSKFSVERWNEDIYGRERILDDFLANHEFVGMSYDEVVGYFGSNSGFSILHSEESKGSTQPPKQPPMHPIGAISYVIGTHAYSGVHIFTIRFDENEKVTDYETHYRD